MSLGLPEILVILVVALLVLGPSKLPDAARQMGKAMAEFRRVTSGFQSEVRDAFESPFSAAPPPPPTDAQIPAPAAVPPAETPDATPAAAPPPAQGPADDTSFIDQLLAPAAPADATQPPAGPEPERHPPPDPPAH